MTQASNKDRLLAAPLKTAFVAIFAAVNGSQGLYLNPINVLQLLGVLFLFVDLGTHVRDNIGKLQHGRIRRIKRCDAGDDTKRTVTSLPLIPTST